MILLLVSWAWAIERGVLDVEGAAAVGIIDGSTSAQRAGALIAIAFPKGRPGGAA